MQKFQFTNEAKTEIRHNLVPEFLIEVVKLETPNFYEGIGFEDVFDEEFIRGHHFLFKIKDDEFESINDDEVFHLRSICRRAGKWYKSQVVAGFISLEKYQFIEGNFEDEKFKLVKSDNPNWWLVADKETNYTIEFEKNNYNESQKVVNFGNQEVDMMKSARIIREIGDWLSKNHQNLL